MLEDLTDPVLAAALAHASEGEDDDFAPRAFPAARGGGPLWIPGAERLTPTGSSGAMLADGPPRAVWHTTEAPSGGPYFDRMRAVLTGKKAEPHVLYDPLTDRLGQFFPLDRSARALRNGTGVYPNRTGTVCVQVEVVAYASKPFTSYWRPGPNFRALLAALEAWGVPAEWPAGAMSRAGEGVDRALTRWRTRGGHYGHCHVPANTHWDCGGIDQGLLLAASAGPTSAGGDPLPPAAPPPSVPATPQGPTPHTVRVLKVTRPLQSGDDVRGWQGELWRVGIGVGEHDGVYGPSCATGTRQLQRAAGIGVDGTVGPATRAAAGKVRDYPKVGGLVTFAAPGGAAGVIRAFQQRLHDRGWRGDGPDGRIVVDGLMSPGGETARVIEAFQREKGLDADGVGGADVWVALWTR